MAGTEQKLDGKFEVIRELERDDFRRSIEARRSDGSVVRVDWFTVGNPKSRSHFHRYRSTLRAVNSPLLLDVVARPGAYYTVWQPSTAPEALARLASHPKDDAFHGQLETLANTLAEHGFALQDANILATESRENGRTETRAVVADLRLNERSAEEIARLNRTALTRPSQGRSRWPFGRNTTKDPAAPTPPPSSPPMPIGGGLALAGAGGGTLAAPRPSPPRRLTIWGVLPGLLLLGLAVYLGFGATQKFLEPPVVTVPELEGKSVLEAGKLLEAARLKPRIDYYSDQTKPKGTILRQNPPAGTALTESRIVEITVNKPKPLTAPNLEGRIEGDARFSLKELGLTVSRVVRIPITDPNKRGIVLAQNPPPDSELVKGQGLILLVGGDRPAPGKTFLPDLKNLSFEDAKYVISKSGLRLVEVKQRYVANLPANTVLEQSPAPYARVDTDGDVTLTVSSIPEALNPVKPTPVTRPSPPVASPPAAPEPAPPPAQTVTPPPATPEPTPPPAQATPTPPPAQPAVPDTTPTPEPAPPPVQATPTPPPATAEPPATNTITNPPPIESENRSVSYRFTVPGTGTVKTSITTRRSRALPCA